MLHFNNNNKDKMKVVKVFIEHLVDKKYEFSGDQTVGDMSNVLFDNKELCIELMDNNRKPKRIVLERGDTPKKIKDIDRFENGHIYIFYPGDDYSKS